MENTKTTYLKTDDNKIINKKTHKMGEKNE